MDYKILIIDDDVQLSSYLKESFEIRKHSVTVLNNSVDALKFLPGLQKSSFDVVLLDLNMPDVSGWEILARIRSLPEIANYPVIMLTGADDESTEAKALYDGADDFVPKPSNTKVLLARIEANVRKKQSAPLASFSITASQENFNELSDREKEILTLLAKGYTNKEIARDKVISDQTVMNHLKNIFRKIKVENRVQAAITAIKYGLI